MKKQRMDNRGWRTAPVCSDLLGQNCKTDGWNTFRERGFWAEIHPKDIILMACPFCGTLPRVLDGRIENDGKLKEDYGVQVCCEKCLTLGPFARTCDKAIKLWNRRMAPCIERKSLQRHKA